jgi:phospholipid/cholesterol/gamma-HCH transport system substrate-binding protein
MKSANKVVVGIFVAVCIALFAVGLFLIGNSNQLFTKSFQVYADFSGINGIVKGGKVRVAGMDAGTVTSIDVPSGPEGKFRIHLRVIEKLHPLVRQDSVASIQTDGLLGNKYLQIVAGSEKEPLARDRSMIRSAEPFDWGDLMDQISSAVKQVNGVLSGAKEQLTSTLAEIEGVSRSANLLIKDATPQVKNILVSANAISGNLRDIIDGVQQGEGTVGALLKDQELETTVRRGVGSAEQAVANIRQTAASANKTMEKVRESDIVPEVQRTVKNLQQITLQVKEAVDKFQTAAGEGDVVENLQRTLADAHEAMSDLSDDTEALKHNFFFRGFFKRRGFYDLGALTATEYKKPAFAKGFKKYRVWLDSVDLFRKAGDGTETLSVDGKRRLDEAMTEVLQFPRNGPLMIEGFTGAGTTSQQYLQGRQRAARVEAYLVGRFHLRPAYVGVVSMGAVADSIEAGRFKEGVGIVSFYK